LWIFQFFHLTRPLITVSIPEKITGVSLLNKLFNKLDGKTHIIWDWNGTLLNDVDSCHQTLTDLLIEFELPPITLDYYRETFHFPVKSFYRESLGLEVSEEIYQKMQVRFGEIYKSYLENTQLFEGTLNLFEKISNTGIKQSVLSAAYEPDLISQLTDYNIAPYLSHIYGLSDIHAASKEERAKQLRAQIPDIDKDIILIGDTAHDLEVANAIGVDCLLIGDGHYTVDRLISVHNNVLTSRYKG
jgi:phosphoglycolate phosphatase